MVPFGILQLGYHEMNLGNLWQFVTHTSKTEIYSVNICILHLPLSPARDLIQQINKKDIFLCYKAKNEHRGKRKRCD